MRSRRRTLPFLLAFLFAAACGERAVTTGPDAAAPTAGLAAGSVVGSSYCVSYDALVALAEEVFSSSSPDRMSVLGKLDNLRKQVEAGNTLAARDQAFNIVEFVLAKHREKKIGGGDAVTALINGVFCFAGVNVEPVVLGADAWIVHPADTTQLYIAGDGLSGLEFPAGSVLNAPMLVTIAPTTGEALGTKLDKYPAFREINASGPGSLASGAFVYVEICVTASVPDEVLERLRLGHKRSTGFEITPQPGTPKAILTCPEPSGTAWLPEWLRDAADLLLPRTLHAAMIGTGGIGGLANEFSPFGPVDTELSATGGIGGLANEFMRSVQVLGSAGDGCATFDATTGTFRAPIGTALEPGCRPVVTVRTANGTLFHDVPVTFTVEQAGAATVATDLPYDPAGPDCGPFGVTTTATTNANGNARACVTMGNTPGSYTLRATPAVGGDAPAGVTFDPASTVFTLVVTPPTQLRITTQPTTMTAGTPFTVSVEAADANGLRAAGYTGAVTLALNGGTWGSGATTVTMNAVGGVATFTGLTVHAAASGYTVTATGSYADAALTSATSAAFTVTPAAPFALDVVSGSGVTQASGTTVNPVVRLRDAYGNSIPGASIAWTVEFPSTATAAPTPTTTGADGRTSTTWTLGDEANQLRAHLVGSPAIEALFSASGTSSLAALLACSTGGSGDRVESSGDDPVAAYGFRFGWPGGAKSIRNITLYFASAGRANALSSSVVEVSLRANSFAVTPLRTVTQTVTLRGNNSEWQAVTFALPTPITSTELAGNTTLAGRIRVLSNEDGSSITFNTGPCPLGSSCKLPPSCKVEEVVNVSGDPALGTLRRRSVGIVVKGT